MEGADEAPEKGDREVIGTSSSFVFRGDGIGQGGLLAKYAYMVVTSIVVKSVICDVDELVAIVVTKLLVIVVESTEVIMDASLLGSLAISMQLQQQGHRT